MLLCVITGLILKKNKIVILVFDERYCSSCMFFQNDVSYCIRTYNSYLKRIIHKHAVPNSETYYNKNITSFSNQWSLQRYFTFNIFWIINISSQPVGGSCWGWILSFQASLAGLGGGRCPEPAGARLVPWAAQFWSGEAWEALVE